MNRKSFFILLFLFISLNSFAQEKSKPANDPFAKESMPSYPGGQAAMLKFVQDNLQLPEGFSDKNISGQVIVKFLIDKAGNVGDVTVQKGLEPALDKAAVTVIRSMPKWNPGMKEGNPVDAYLTLPVNITTKK